MDELFIFVNLKFIINIIYSFFLGYPEYFHGIIYVTTLALQSNIFLQILVWPCYLLYYDYIQKRSFWIFCSLSFKMWLQLYIFICKILGGSSPSCLHYHKNNVNVFCLNTTSIIQISIKSSYLFRLARQPSSVWIKDVKTANIYSCNYWFDISYLQ